jgi:hypothetical protein
MLHKHRMLPATPKTPPVTARMPADWFRALRARATQIAHPTAVIPIDVATQPRYPEPSAGNPAGGSRRRDRKVPREVPSAVSLTSRGGLQSWSIQPRWPKDAADRPNSQAGSNRVVPRPCPPRLSQPCLAASGRRGTDPLSGKRHFSRVVADEAAPHPLGTGSPSPHARAAREEGEHLSGSVQQFRGRGECMSSFTSRARSGPYSSRIGTKGTHNCHSLTAATCSRRNPMTSSRVEGSSKE